MLVQQDKTVHEIFEYLKARQHCSMDFSFSSDEELNDTESMLIFLDEHDLTEHIAQNRGAMVFLKHADYDFQIVVESDGQGDAYTHGITVFVNEGESQ